MTTPKDWLAEIEGLIETGDWEDHYLEVVKELLSAYKDMVRRDHRAREAVWCAMLALVRVQSLVDVEEDADYIPKTIEYRDCVMNGREHPHDKHF